MYVNGDPVNLSDPTGHDPCGNCNGQVDPGGYEQGGGGGGCAYLCNNPGNNNNPNGYTPNTSPSGKSWQSAACAHGCPKPPEPATPPPATSHDGSSGWCGSQGSWCTVVPPSSGYKGPTKTCIVVGSGGTDEVQAAANIDCSAFTTRAGAAGPSYMGIDPVAVSTYQQCFSDPGSGLSHCDNPPPAITPEKVVAGVLFIPDIGMVIVDPPAGVALTWATIEITTDATVYAYGRDHDGG